MKELKSGTYLIKNNKAELTTLEPKGCVRFVTKDETKINLNKFDNCIMYISNTPLNQDISIYQLEDKGGIKININTIKEIKKDLKIKNRWVYETYFFNGEIYETKRYNNWFQIFRNAKTKINIPFAHFETQKAVINNLLQYAKEGF